MEAVDFFLRVRVDGRRGERGFSSSAAEEISSSEATRMKFCEISWFLRRKFQSLVLINQLLL